MGLDPNPCLCNAGHEIVALQWVLEQASPAIARTLAAIPDSSAAAVAIPDAEGIPPDKMIRLFGYAVKFANSGNLPMEDTEALNLWTLAAMLQVGSLALQSFHDCS